MLVVVDALHEFGLLAVGSEAEIAGQALEVSIAHGLELLQGVRTRRVVLRLLGSRKRLSDFGQRSSGGLLDLQGHVGFRSKLGLWRLFGLQLLGLRLVDDLHLGLRVGLLCEGRGQRRRE